MGLTFSKKQKITSAIYEEFKKQRGDKPKDENFDYDYACFLENKIAEIYGVGKPVTTSENSLHKHFVNTRNYRLVMLHDYNVVQLEWNRPHTYIRCLIGGFIWRFMPDLTFKHRRFMIVDYGC